MKILIIENELYLAQSIASKLYELGYSCEITTNAKNALNPKDDKFDAVLLSTNISNQNIYPIIEKYKQSIIILMVSYISNDTISNPIKAGADDYIQKPFMIEELIRKLEHLKNYNKVVLENRIFSSYIENLFDSFTPNTQIDKRISSPLLIKCSKQLLSDAIVFKYARDFQDSFDFISCKNGDIFDKIAKSTFGKLLYITNIQEMKKSDKEKLFNVIEQKRVVLSSTSKGEDFPYKTLHVNSEDNLFDKFDILTIDDYVKHVVIHFQNSLPDTELSKKLGISRKSLWEKRKKYGIQKK
ncbi:MAG: response regulator [Campylobacteraceae bacterium]